MTRSRSKLRAVVAAVALLAVAGVVALGCGGGGEEEAKAQTVRFQKPTSNGPDPFTKPADVRGKERVDVGSGPFGGTGSDLVCDRELLIRSLRARPERLREWARVLRVDPTSAAVARYIRKLRPVTLTRDTRVTNHSFVGGRAVAYQAILQAGTAVLVDKDGKPVARCRCGNPLLEPVFIREASCVGCPPNYKPPPPCEYYDYDDEDYEHFDDEDFKETFDRSDYRGKCYVLIIDPPGVRTARRERPPPAPEEPATAPPPEQPTPEPGLHCDPPRSQLEAEQCNPPEVAPETTHEPAPQPEQPHEPECDVARFRANGCADIRDKSTEPGIQP